MIKEFIIKVDTEKSDYMGGTPLLETPQEICRCKDCKYWHDSIRCQLDSEGLKTPGDWFCADGERR